jgi:hypothetical protein
LDIASNLPLLGVLCPTRHRHLCSLVKISPVA